MEDVGRELVPLKKQGKVEGFFNNTENAGKLSSLVEEVRDAMMEYQVYESATRLCKCLTSVADFIVARYL